MFVKINGTLVQKQKHILQISVQEIHNDIILPTSEGGFLRAKTVYGKICIGYKSLRKYMPKYIKPMSNRNKITCGCKTCIGAILLQSDNNKWRISQLAKLDKLHINSASTITLEIPKNGCIEFNKQIFPNDSHIHLRACDSASSYHCPSLQLLDQIFLNRTLF